MPSPRNFVNALLENFSDGVVACNAQGVLSVLNPAAEELVELPLAPLPPEQWAAHYRLFRPDGRTLCPTAELPLYRALQGERVENQELVIAPLGHAPRMIIARGGPIVSRSGRTLGAVVAFNDAARWREIDPAVARLSSLSRLLGSVNQLVAEVRTSAELFGETCRLAVQSGCFRLAWIGTIEGDAVVIAAAHGEGASKLQNQRYPLWPGLQEPPGLLADLLRGRVPYIVDDLRDPARGSWLHAITPLAEGACASFPLRVGQSVLGWFSLLADSAGFFGRGELEVLTAMADHLARALDFVAREEKLDYLTYYDPLTRLANRSLLIERLTQICRSTREIRSRSAVVLVDLVDFDRLSASLGRAGGEELLKQVASRLTQFAGGVSNLARGHGDLFAVIVPDLKEAGELTRDLEVEIWEFLREPFMVQGAPVRVSVRLGAAVFPDDAEDAEGLLANAQAALLSAKSSGQRYAFYSREITAAAAERIALERELGHALERQEFVLHYQPKVALAGGVIVGAEALMRWNSPSLGLVPPARFVPLLEESGQILEVGQWALQQAARDHSAWSKAGLAVPNISVNVSPVQLKQSGFVDSVLQALGVPPGTRSPIDLEITESLLMTEWETTIHKLQTLRALGLRIAIDDFGTGYSSLSYLAKLPIDEVKVDRSFIVTMTDSADTMAIVSSIVALAHTLNLKAVAEGVDKQEQLKFLRLLRCDEIQGFLFSPALPAAEFEKLLRQGRRL